jgi:hypothetical protein
MNIKKLKRNYKFFKIYNEQYNKLCYTLFLIKGDIIMTIGIIGWIVLCILVAVYASGKGKSGAVYFFISLILSPLIGFIIAAVSGGSKDTGIFKIRIAKDSILMSEEYKTDSNTYGDWLVTEEGSLSYVTISTQRAYDFLLKKLEEDNKKTLRDRLIESRQGKILS